MTKEDLQQIKELFDESFAVNFDRSFDKAFDRKFPSAFKNAFEEAFPPAFTNAFNNAFPSAFTDAFDNAFPTAFSDGFAEEFPRAFNNAFPSALADTTATPSFATTLQEILRPDFDQIRQDISEFKDQVLTREDRTLKELLSIRQELTFLGVRVTRLENHPRLA